MQCAGKAGRLLRGGEEDHNGWLRLGPGQAHSGQYEKARLWLSSSQRPETRESSTSAVSEII